MSQAIPTRDRPAAASRLHLLRFFLAIELLVGAGCTGADFGAESSSPGALLDLAEPAPTPGGPSLDDIFLSIGEEVDGFAGMYRDSAGRTVIRTADMERVEEAKDRVAARFVGQPGMSRQNLRVEAAVYSFAELGSLERQTLSPRRS